MNYADFLATCQNENLRRHLFSLYQRVEAFFSSLDFDMTVVRVIEGGPDYSGDDRLIRIPVDEEDKGVIFHEATHALFHDSVFHRTHNQVNAFPPNRDEDPKFNESWGEGFCDAVRWLMESECIPDSKWLSQTYTTEVAYDWRKQRAERILNWTGRDLKSFATGWRKLVAKYDKKGDFLNRTIT